MADPASETVLETRRLVLRPPASGDLPWIMEHINTSAVMRHLGDVRSPERVAEALDADIEAFGTGGHRRWTVWLRDGETRVGRCGLFHVKTDAAPTRLRGQNEIGWSLAEDHWRHGYATEAARAVLGFGFSSLALRAIYSQTSDRNDRSTRMMARLGMRRVAGFDYDDPDYAPEENPTRVYVITRAEWAARGDG